MLKSNLVTLAEGHDFIGDKFAEGLHTFGMAQFLGVGEEHLDPADPGVLERPQVGRDHVVRPVEHRVQPDVHRGRGGGGGFD